MPQKNLILEVWATPDEVGFRDTLMYVPDAHPRYACPCRSGPNWRSPASKGGKPWPEVYDWIAPGTYQWRYRCTEKRGPHILINDGKEVPSRNPRPNPDGSIFRWVEIHCAWRDDWPGSAGCVTIQRMFWVPFMSFFKPGDSGKLIVADRIP